MPSPADVRSYRRHADWALAAALGADLGVYETLSEGPAATDDLAERLGLSPRGAGVLLGALETLGAVRREPDGRWRLTGTARAHWVDRDTPDFEGDSLRHWLRQVRLWTTELPAAIRQGGPPSPPTTSDAEAGTSGAAHGAPSDPEQLARFMAAMDNKDPILGRAVVEAALERVPGARRMLDLGGGPGTFARAFAARGLEATLFDRPEVIDHVRGAYGLDEVARLETRAGDFLEAPPEGEWDIILLANITHIYSPERNAALLLSLAPRVAGGGMLAILDMVRGPSEFAALFALQMLLHTEEGGTYDLAAYRTWMEDTGFAEVRWRSLTDDVQLVSGIRSDA